MDKKIELVRTANKTARDFDKRIKQVIVMYRFCPKSSDSNIRRFHSRGMNAFIHLWSSMLSHLITE